MRGKYVVLFSACLVFSGCGNVEQFDNQATYIFDSVPEKGEEIVIASEETVYLSPLINGSVPVSVGDVDGYGDGITGIYLTGLWDSGDLTNYAYPDGSIVTPSMTEDDRRIIRMQEDEAWDYVTNEVFTSYPKQSFAEIENDIREIADNNTSIITVNVWYWSNPNDSEDMSKTTMQVSYKVNSQVANLFQHIFQDIYNDPSKPIINIEDSASGTWVIRGKLHNSSSTLSAHSIGTCIDLNPSTGSYNIDGVWYGNGYGMNVMSTSQWNALPESHTKYHVLYEDSPIVQIFKAYGFYWGGDWSSTKDPMHFAYLGDGGGRSVGYSNYIEAGGY